MVAVAIVIIIAFVVMKLELNAQFCAVVFSRGNTLVFGKKRKGKDLFMQKIIHIRNKEYFSNITYGKKRKEIALKEIDLAPNTYENFIQDDITQIEKRPDREKVDIYLSDIAVMLPSQYQHLLVKRYKGMPLEYALQGHLYDSNIHCTYNGSYGRLWDKLREQADNYFKALVTVKMPFALYVRVRFFEEEQSARDNVLPFQKGMDKNTRALRKQHKATYGKIENMWIRIPRRIIKYDTRAFEEKMFTKESIEASRKYNKAKKWKLLKKIKKVLVK